MHKQRHKEIQRHKENKQTKKKERLQTVSGTVCQLKNLLSTAMPLK
jgi:hypothetical protein